MILYVDIIRLYERIFYSTIHQNSILVPIILILILVYLIFLIGLTISIVPRIISSYILLYMNYYHIIIPANICYLQVSSPAV